MVGNIKSRNSLFYFPFGTLREASATWLKISFIDFRWFCRSGHCVFHRSLCIKVHSQAQRIHKPCTLMQRLLWNLKENTISSISTQSHCMKARRREIDLPCVSFAFLPPPPSTTMSLSLSLCLSLALCLCLCLSVCLSRSHSLSVSVCMSVSVYLSVSLVFKSFVSQLLQSFQTQNAGILAL